MSGGAGDYMGNMFFKLQTVDTAGTTDSSNTGWADPFNAGWADSSNTGWADSSNTGWADSSNTGWVGLFDPNGIVEFGDESDLASKEPDEPLSLEDKTFLNRNIAMAGLPRDLRDAVAVFLNDATYEQAIELLEKLDERGNSDDTLDVSDGLETMTSGELSDIIAQIEGEAGETEEADA